MTTQWRRQHTGAQRRAPGGQRPATLLVAALFNLLLLHGAAFPSAATAGAQARLAGPVAAGGDLDLARVVELTNAERVAAGVGPLAGDPQLTVAAQRYAEVMADTACFGHACGPVPRLADRALAAGDTRWGFLGENVAAGQPTPERVVAAWMASPTHRAVLLNPEFTRLGVGRTVGGQYGTYWTQEFGHPAAGARQR